MLLIFIINQFLHALANITTVDLTKCKVTHVGGEYRGRMATTVSNATCQYWSSSVEKGASELLDETFPDGSKILAKNYCRNPNMAASGPWCYTTNKKLITDSCKVPLCKMLDCRVTGPGMEYAGNISKSASGRKCKKWRHSHKLEKRKESPIKDSLFPDGTAYDAQNMCRNPDGNLTGPWCYVEKEDSKFEEIEFCDVPFCDNIDPLMFSKVTSRKYILHSSFNDSDSIKFDIRLWDEADWLRGAVYIYLTGLDTHGNSSDIERWKSGVEIMLSNSGSRIMNSKDSELKATRDILSAVKWTTIEIGWNMIDDMLVVQIFRDGELKPFIITELDIKDTVLDDEASFRFFSLSGSPSIWNVSSDVEECFVHTSPTLDFSRHYLMKKTTLGVDVDIYVRAVKHIVMLLRVAPMMKEHQIEILIGDGDGVKVTYYGEENRAVILSSASKPKILDFWKWENFKISILQDRLQVYRDKPVEPELIIDVTNQRLASVMWITFGSPYVSYWAVYCDPREFAPPPKLFPPECITSDNNDFSGTLSVTKAGHQCVPWIDDEAIPEEYQKKELYERFGGKTACKNYCRNLDKDPQGPFCFIKDKQGKFVKESCYPRPCNLGECKIAGTANDYIGHQNKTRSKRMCLPWTKFANEDRVVVKNFPDPTLEDAGNFCRNPSKSVGGTWCYTKDQNVPTDYCYIRDCDKPLESTVITAGYRTGHYIYILPRWRKYGIDFWLKAWNPDIYEGVKIKLISLEGDRSYNLHIGDDNNEKLKFFYANPDEEEVLLTQKTLPHLIPAGKWGGFWLRPDFGKVELGYHGVNNSFFEWTSKNKSMSFDPMFFDFGTINGHWVGVNFKLTECLLERTSSNNPNRIYPINLWQKDETKVDSVPSKLVLHLRGVASFAIILMSNPDFNEYISVMFSSDGEKISIWEYKWNWSNRKLVEYHSFSSFSADRWTEYELGFREKSISLTQDRTLVFTWESRQHLLFYWFSIKILEGYVVWSANCPPGDIDPPPRNGQWGAWEPWTCSATCGGGHGRTQRHCNNPPPNVLGRECPGSGVYDGPCNTFPCGEISPETNDLIRWHLSSKYTSLEVEAGKKVVLTCNENLRNAVMNEVKKMNISWTFNGFPYSQRRARINKDYSLVIPKASEQDNGVYLCFAHQKPERTPSKVVIDVYSLIVNRTTATRKIHKGRSLSLKCNGLALSYVYGDLSQKWEINGTVWKNYGITSLETVNLDKIEEIGDEHNGIWTCVIVQNDLGFQWKTNWMNIKVKSIPNFWTHLTEDAATAPLFGKLGSEKAVKAVFFIVVAVLLILILLPSFILVKFLYSDRQ